MSALFWGFFFVYINFNLIVNGHVLNVLPAFVGYALIMKSCREMEGESGLFSSIRPFALGMAVYTGILWLGDLLAVTGQGGGSGHPGCGGPPGRGAEQRFPENRLDGAGRGPGGGLGAGSAGFSDGFDGGDRGPGGYRLVPGGPVAQPEIL